MLVLGGKEMTDERAERIKKYGTKKEQRDLKRGYLVGWKKEKKPISKKSPR
jgi:hypothetical protein